MNHLEIGNVVETILETNYPGGIDKFNEDGSSILFLNTTAELLICSKHISKELESVLVKECIKLGIDLKVYEVSNFEGCNNNERMNFLSNLCMFLDKYIKDIRDITVAIFPATILIELPNIQSKNKVIKEIYDYLDKFEEFERAHIICEDRTVSLFRTYPHKEVHIITSDDVIHIHKNIDSLLEQLSKGGTNG